MPRQIVDLWEHHRPGAVGDASDELSVDEVAEAAGREAQRAQGCNEVGDIEPASTALSRVEPQPDQDAKKAAVKAHSALPHLQDLERLNKVLERFVKQHVAETSAQNHADNAVEQHVVDVARMPTGQQVLARAFAAEYHEEDKAEQVHETVPTDRERPDDDAGDVDRSDV